MHLVKCYLAVEMLYRMEVMHVHANKNEAKQMF